MTDRNRIIGQGAFEPDPPRDKALGALLREQMGSVPVDEVDWGALAQGISARIAAHVASPWWTYTSRWERRLIPIALAAGLAAAAVLMKLESNASTFVSAASVSNAVISGTPVEDAAFQFAHSVTSVADISTAVLQ